MNDKRFIIFFVVLGFILPLSGLCYGKDPKSNLTVKNIVFTPDKASEEWVTLLCNQSCTPELFALEGENPRVVMNLKEVSSIQTKSRNITTGGKLVKRIRSYLDKQTKVLRVVLDLEPSKNYTVHPSHSPSKNAYMLRIEEPGQKAGEGKEKRITILSLDVKPKKEQGSKPQVAATGPKDPGPPKTVKDAPPLEPVKAQESKPQEAVTIQKVPPASGAAKDVRPLEPVKVQESKPQEAAEIPKDVGAPKALKDPPSLEKGKEQLNAGQFAAAADTFTRILAADPKSSMGYHFRGNAYDNLGDRQKAIKDWIQAARLGDASLRSYLDFLQVKWEESPAPSQLKKVTVIGNRDSKRYHLPGMKYYDKVKAYHRVVFQSEKEAINAGYRKAAE